MKLWKCGLLLTVCLLLCRAAIGEEAVNVLASPWMGENDFTGHWVYPGEDENYAEMDIYEQGDGSLRMSVFFLRMLSFDATLLPPEDGITTFDDTDDELSGELTLRPDGTLLLTVLSDSDNYFHDFFHGVEFVFNRDGTARTGDAEEAAAVPESPAVDRFNDFDDAWGYEDEEEGTIPAWVLSYDDVLAATRDFYLGEWHRIEGKDGLLVISGQSEADLMLRLTIAGCTFDARFDSLVGDGDTMMFFTTDGLAELDMTYGVDGVHLSGWAESGSQMDFFTGMHLIFARQADVQPEPEPAVNLPEEPVASLPGEEETAIRVPEDDVSDESELSMPEEPAIILDGPDLPPVPGRPDLFQVPVDRVNATSWIIGTKDPMAYTPERIIDGDETTSWQFSTKTTKLGEAYLYFEFNNPVILNELWIKNGFWKTTGGTDAYTRNCRVKTMTIEFRYSAGESYAFPQEVPLPDDKARTDWQRIPLSADRPVIGVRIRIDEIYKGTKYNNDVCISEIMFVQAAGL